MAATLAVMPKSTKNHYFMAARQGAEEAASTLGASLLWDGPVDENPLRQHEIVEAWTARRVDVISVSASDHALIAPALRAARAAGIKVMTWDADSEPDARDFFVQPATAEAVSQTLSFEIGRVLLGKGEVALITSAAGAANQGEWARKLKERLPKEQPGIKLVDVVSCPETMEAAEAAASTLLKARPALAAIVGLSSPAVPGAAQAVKKAGRQEVKVLGLSTPNDAREFIKGGWIESIVMWNAVDLGYLTVAAANAMATGELTSGCSLIVAGRLGKVMVRGDEVRLGRPYIFTKNNIDQHRF